MRITIAAFLLSLAIAPAYGALEMPERYEQSASEFLRSSQVKEETLVAAINDWILNGEKPASEIVTASIQRFPGQAVLIARAAVAAAPDQFDAIVAAAIAAAPDQAELIVSAVTEELPTAAGPTGSTETARQLSIPSGSSGGGSAGGITASSS